MNYGWTPRTSTSDCVIWRKREHNKEADFLASIAMDQMQDATYIWEGWNTRRNEPHMLMGWSDGGHRFKGKSGGGWIIKAWFEEGPVPVVVAAGSEFYSDTDIADICLSGRVSAQLTASMLAQAMLSCLTNFLRHSCCTTR